VQAGVRGLEGARERLGDLAHRELFDLVEDEHVTLLRGQLLQNGEQSLAETAELEIALLVGRYDRLRGIVAGVLAASADGAAAVARGVNAYLAYPGPQRPALLVLAESAMDDDEHLLTSVLEVRRIDAEIPEGAAHIVDVRVEKLVEVACVGGRGRCARTGGEERRNA
jgi:hypothetical protein